MKHIISFPFIVLLIIIIIFGTLIGDLSNLIHRRKINSQFIEFLRFLEDEFFREWLGRIFK